MNTYKLITCLFIVVLFTSCNNTQQTGGGHSHDDITIPYTGYSDQIEAFADIQPLAAGTNSQLIIHFTDLESFKPVEAEKLTVSLIVGTKGLRVVSEQPVQKGIFKVTIQPGTAGIGRLDFELMVKSQKHNVSIKNVEVYGNEHDAIHEAEAKIPSSTNAISFTKEQSWKVEFETRHPNVLPFGNIIKATAKVAMSPANQMIVAAKSSGFVQYSTGILSEGQMIADREWLMTISGKGLTENNAIVRLQEAKVEYDIAKSEYERDKRLFEQKIVSQKEILESKARFENATTQWHNLQNTLSQAGEKIVSPTKGIVHQVLVQNGEYVTAGTPLISVVQQQRMILKAMVRQSHLTELKDLYDASIELNNGEILSLDELNGRIVSVAQSINDESYLLPVTIEMDHHTNLLSGGFANVYLKTKNEESVVVVPRSSLVETQGVFFVYTQLTPELFERRQVKVGASDGKQCVIVSGLKSDDRIVSKGAMLVKLAAVSNTVDPHAGHVH